MKYLLAILMASIVVFDSAYANTITPIVDTKNALPDCETLSDVEGKFPVEGTMENGRRSCAWASRKPEKKEKRCQIDVVRENCPITCDVPCNSSKGRSPTFNGAFNSDIQEEKKVPEALIVILPLAFIALGAFAAAYFVDRRDKRGSEEPGSDAPEAPEAHELPVSDQHGYNVPGYDVPGPDDKSLMESPGFSESHASLTSEADSDYLLNEDKEFFQIEIGVPVQEEIAKQEITPPPRQNSISTQEALKRKCEECPC